MGFEKKPRATEFGLEVGPEISPELAYRRTLAILGWTIGFFVGIWLLGFSLAVPTTIILYLKFAKEKWPITLALALVAWLFFYGLFDYALHVPFPDGQLFLWLGLIAS
ncbi:MAG: hypothetical protein A2W10_02625 [Deltaproteobacteria bacterium RBG_16_55_12]|nr:MAG: hypothetical protein A2W10_02625 [Deltaproteobacteria bacterium RBG_16_55_12]